MLAGYFPRPGNALIGLWALAQAQALKRRGLELHVAALTPWFPRKLDGLDMELRAWDRVRAAARCPLVYRWDDLTVHYPRWAYYNLERLNRVFYRRPTCQLQVAWLTARRGMVRTVRACAPDVVCAQQARSGGLVAERLNRAFGLPFVVAEHDVDEIEDCFSMPARRRLYRRVLGRAAYVIVPSRRMQQGVQRLVPEARVEVLHNGADALPTEVTEARRPAELRNRLVVFSAGFFYDRKEFPVLVRAFALIASKHPRAILRIVGEGSDRQAIERAIAESPFPDRITLLGTRPHRDVLQEMAWADIFALIGRDEAWGVVHTEAMAAGCPILWASDGGIADVLTDGLHGFGVPPGDPVLAAAHLDLLLSDEALRERMALATRGLHERELTWDANAEALEAILRRVAFFSHSAKTSPGSAAAERCT